MEYHEFVCAGAPCLFLAAAEPDPARIPAAGAGCCRECKYVAPFHIGDGSHTPAVEGSIKAGVATEGYHLYISRRPA